MLDMYHTRAVLTLISRCCRPGQGQEAAQLWLEAQRKLPTLLPAGTLPPVACFVADSVTRLTDALHVVCWQAQPSWTRRTWHDDASDGHGHATAWTADVWWLPSADGLRWAAAEAVDERWRRIIAGCNRWWHGLCRRVRARDVSFVCRAIQRTAHLLHSPCYCTHVSCPYNVYCPGAGCPHNNCKRHARHHQPRERASFAHQWRVTVLAVLDAIGALVVLGDVPLETASCRHNGRCRCFS